MRTRSTAKEWKKVLFEHQDFPDNYVPPCFLKDLRKNVNLQHYSLTEVIVASGRLSQEISAIALFTVVYILLEATNETKTTIVYSLVTFTTFVLYATLVFLSSEGVGPQMKSAAIFLVSGFAISPILKTLTETVSTDTVYAMVTVMMIAHLIFYDYGVQCAIVSTPISLNAGVFGAVCLASRLSTTYHAFALLIWASDVFVLFTVARNRCRESLTLRSQSGLTITLAIMSVTCFYFTVAWLYSLLYLLLMIFVNLIFPIGFYRWQSYKENIYGPWDEAVIQTLPQSSRFNN